jgi:hypothetical protein
MRVFMEITVWAAAASHLCEGYGAVSDFGTAQLLRSKGETAGRGGSGAIYR